MKDWTTDNRSFGDYRFRRFARKWLHKSCKLKYPFCSVKNYVVKEMINVIRRENTFRIKKREYLSVEVVKYLFSLFATCIRFSISINSIKD